MQHAVELKNILTQELDIYLQLLALGKEKTKLMVDRKLTELQATVAQEEELVQQLIDFEPLRQEQVMAMVGEPTVKLEVLVEKVSDEALKTELIDLGSKLREVVEEIKVINDGNQRLAQAGLEVAQHTIRIMTRVPKPATYGPGKGQPNNSQPNLRGRSLFDLKA